MISHTSYHDSSASMLTSPPSFYQHLPSSSSTNPTLAILHHQRLPSSPFTTQQVGNTFLSQAINLRFWVRDELSLFSKASYIKCNKNISINSSENVFIANQSWRESRPISETYQILDLWNNKSLFAVKQYDRGQVLLSSDKLRDQNSFRRKTATVFVLSYTFFWCCSRVSKAFETGPKL